MSFKKLILFFRLNLSITSLIIWFIKLILIQLIFIPYNLGYFTRDLIIFWCFEWAIGFGLFLLIETFVKIIVVQGKILTEPCGRLWWVKMYRNIPGCMICKNPAWWYLIWQRSFIKARAAVTPIDFRILRDRAFVCNRLGHLIRQSSFIQTRFALITVELDIVLFLFLHNFFHEWFCWRDRVCVCIELRHLIRKSSFIQVRFALIAVELDTVLFLHLHNFFHEWFCWL